MTDTPAGVSPVGTSPEALNVDVKVTELRRLYFIVFGLTLGIRIAVYAAAVVAFFLLPTRWSTLALIVLLLVGGRICAHAHSWAWSGYRNHSIHADDPVMRERVVYEDSQARAQKAAQSKLVQEARARTLAADAAAKEALEQIDQISQTASERADKAVALAKDRAAAAAADAKRIAEDARAAAQSLVTESNTSAAVAKPSEPAAPQPNEADAVEPEAQSETAPDAEAQSPVVVKITDAEELRAPVDSADKAPVRPAV